MKRHSGFLLLVVVALSATAIEAGPGTAAMASPAGAAAPPARYTARDVLAAFSRAGDALFSAAAGFASPVTELSTVKAYQGWNAAVYVYPTVRQAAASFRGNVATWRASGYAVTVRKNLVVTVVRLHRPASRTVRPWPMPSEILQALALLDSRALG